MDFIQLFKIHLLFSNRTLAITIDAFLVVVAVAAAGLIINSLTGF